MLQKIKEASQRGRESASFLVIFTKDWELFPLESVNGGNNRSLQTLIN